jgi:hypothetical protein
MNINTLISEFNNGNVIVEDVVIEPSFDGTSAEVTVCGPYGMELSTATVADAELDSLKDTFSNCNIIVEPCA